jgi:phosphatidylethanolamine-binding protein (PEBP) family uncharacterized protein
MSKALVLAIIAVMPITAQERGCGARADPASRAMTIAAFPDGGQIPVRFSQAAEGAAPGEGTSPAIAWAKPPADAFETRASVMKALQGHILGKAVYAGLFRRPQ